MRQQFEDIFGYKHITASEIARGGQGVVFRTQNPNIAIKIELDPSGTEFSKDVLQNERLDEIRLLPISRKINLTLPQATLKDYAGYVMTLLDDMDSFEKVFGFSDIKSGYRNRWLLEYQESNPDFVDNYSQYLESGGRRRRLDAYLRVACILSALHANGLVYCDFSSRNAFVSSVEGNSTVWLIDADNLNYQEETRNAGYYTPGYGAPEVITGKGCTFYSDSYAFATSLFWQITGTHPFKGALLEEGSDDDFVNDAEERAYSGELPWIMDRDNPSNHIDARIQQELVLSSRLVNYFGRTFSETGKTKRHTRPTMFEWAAALAKELDLSVRCGHCDMDYDESYVACPWCDTQNQRIVLVSKGANRAVWRYVHELGWNGNLPVPKRILTGFRADECDAHAFSLAYHNGDLIISDLHETAEWSVSIDGGITFIDIYGKAAIPCSCMVKGVIKATGEPTIIEVDIL